ncbi:uncharacterized protein BO95DRAFT_447079 [Aspergillus brunneoviolaceus CBS 621.78]|uniref:Uncharacterized protein n=1 Tax=Aspergillus brunneoviolaceus CBS 621.78 TaxID=1450534 RepID=A0ACD1FWU3_9EURO|nr:hypothetical protein BO95DRAFT_447079 [Aspergillus brunneoviolaceus CBS 621.78]RAH41403.1 hypothetical protein BO95DRAFT_447079 [Aspergillus brunneoviolaceus CBS 621.78]
MRYNAMKANFSKMSPEDVCRPFAPHPHPHSLRKKTLSGGMLMLTCDVNVQEELFRRTKEAVETKFAQEKWRMIAEQMESTSGHGRKFPAATLVKKWKELERVKLGKGQAVGAGAAHVAVGKEAISSSSSLLSSSLSSGGAGDGDDEDEFEEEDGAEDEEEVV